MITSALTVFSIFCLFVALLLNRQDGRFIREIQEQKLRLARLDGVIAGIRSEREQ